jgi:hypothetical protein
VRYDTVTGLLSPVTLFALLDGAEVGVLKVGWVSSIFQLHYEGSAVSPGVPRVSPTRKNSPSVELYGLQGLPLTYFYSGVSAASLASCVQPTRSLVNQKRKQPSMRPKSSSESPMLSPSTRMLPRTPTLEKC